jgi:small GTP-binding protein
MPSQIRTMLTKLFGSPQYRVLILGLDASGKTTILYRLKLNEIVQTIATIGFNVETVVYNKTSLTIWDVGGCDKIRPLIRHYFQNTQAFIFVVDSNDRERLAEATDELWRALNAEELINAPVLIFLNKMDIHGGLKQNDIIQQMRLNDIRNRQWFLQPCTAPTGDGLYEGLDWLTSALKSPHTSPSKQINIELNTSTTATENNDDENQSVQWLSQIDDDTNEEFVEKFEKHQLLSETFDHRTLLRAIWCYLKIHGRKETIKALFDHLGIYVKDMNETLIYFWIQIVHYACEATKNPTNDFSGFLLMNPQILNETELPLTYYKKNTLFSDQAKKTIVLPDLKQLPSILPSSANNKTEKSVNPVNEAVVDELDDDEFLKQFESCTLTNWSHRTHLRMAWLYLTRDGRRAGVNKIFDGIKNFIQNSPTARKTTFHFTMTYFWIQMIDLAIAQSPKDINFEEFLRQNPQLLNGGLFLEYYKKETMLNNPTARQEMVLPDIKPLPTMITSNKKK